MATACVKHKTRNHPHLKFAIFFVVFSLCLLLTLYSIGTRYYEALQMSVPVATPWFQALVPWPMIAFAAIAILALCTIRSRFSQSSSIQISWAIIGCTAVVTMWGAFQLVSPMLSVLSGLGKL